MIEYELIKTELGTIYIKTIGEFFFYWSGDFHGPLMRSRKQRKFHALIVTVKYLHSMTVSNH